MLANLENPAVDTGLEKVSFQPNLKEGQWNTTQLHSFHILPRQCSKSLKLGFSSTWIENFQMHKLVLEKA